MNALVRKLAALSVLWSMCELLMPEGRQRAAVRMTVSVIVMITLLSSSIELMSVGMSETSAAPAISAVMPEEREYAAAALRSLANQAKAVAERFSERAGYDCTAAVYLRLDGSLDHMTLDLKRKERTAPLISENEAVQRLAALFEIDEASIRLTDGAIEE